MSAERGWIGDPQPTAEQRKHSVETWVERHRLEGHHPHPAPTDENPERWECKCEPDAPWTAVWRILTPEQVRHKFAHLRRTRSDGLSDGLKDYIEEIQAEQEALDAARHWPDGPPLPFTDRYAAGRPRWEVS
jgi:hypothetical protein